MQRWGYFAFFRQLLRASPKAPTFGALTPASKQSCAFAVNPVFISVRHVREQVGELSR